MLLELFVNVCAPIFMVVGAGWLLDRRFSLHLESLVKLNIYIMVPAFIFARVVETSLGGAEALWVVGFTASTILVMLAASLLVSRWLGLLPVQRQALSLGTMFYNSGNYGLPLVTLAFGEAGAAVQVYVLATMNVATFTLGLFLAQSRNEQTGAHSRALRAMLRQPTLYALAAGVLCQGLHLPVQKINWIWQPVEILEGGLVGVALLTLGVQMSQTRPAPFRPQLWAALGIRLLLGPLAALGLSWVFRFPPAVSAALILAAGAPTAVNTSLLAHEFGGDVSFATSTVYYSTLFSLGTTTLNLWLLKMYLV